MNKYRTRNTETKAKVSPHQLVRKEENCLERKLSVAEVEEVFQAGAQELHHEHRELSL